jgi:hypothetical protein
MPTYGSSSKEGVSATRIVSQFHQKYQGGNNNKNYNIKIIAKNKKLLHKNLHLKNLPKQIYKIKMLT